MKYTNQKDEELKEQWDHELHHLIYFDDCT